MTVYMCDTCEASHIVASETKNEITCGTCNRVWAPYEGGPVGARYSAGNVRVINERVVLKVITTDLRIAGSVFMSAERAGEIAKALEVAACEVRCLQKGTNQVDIAWFGE